MISIKPSKNRLVKAIFGCFFGILGLILPFFANAANVYADEPDVTEPTVIVTEEKSDETEQETETKKQELVELKAERTCDSSLGSLGWLVCPTTGKISEATDWLYKKNKEVLEINPVKAEEDSPIYQIWNYFLGIANIAFVIFLLIAIYSQITGVGISNYGIKKALPKLIIAAIMVNLSFIVCSLMVDASNIIGNGLRGIFTSIEESTVPYFLTSEAGNIQETEIAMTELYSTLAGGAGLLVTSGFVAFEGGEIWLLIPVAFAALIAVVVGLITIALRQVVVILLIMIAPLAIVAYIMPNTENLFKKWKDLLVKMLVFYPMYSLLFGASSLAGWAIISSAHDGFGLILGTAVKIFPLFFSWSLMKMSGTFLGTVNAKITGFLARPLATNRAWAESHRELTRQKFLASNNVNTPTLRLRQFLADRKTMRDEETGEYANTAKNRGLYLAAKSHYKPDGTITKDGEAAYEMQARNTRYQSFIERDKANFNKGLGTLETVKNSKDYAMRARLNKLDEENVNASDELKMELERSAKIDFDNAKGYYDRINWAKEAQMDKEALEANNTLHIFHDSSKDPRNLERYKTMMRVMEGNKYDVGSILAGAAHSYSAQSQIVRGKFGDLFTLAPPTQDLVNMLNEYTTAKNSNSYIDPIIAGLRVLNARGDTDIVRRQLKNVLEDGKVELGTHTSQALANFFMFDVKGGDPFLRRFGKYINLETAKMYNEGDDQRTRKDITWDEYVNGEYIDHDRNGHVIYKDDGITPKIRTPKRDAAVLMKGTSYKDIERTAFNTMNEGILDASFEEGINGQKAFAYDKFKKSHEKLWDAIAPNVISDQFSYLSGSEQVVSLGKGVTGVDVKKHAFDFDGFFGKEVARTLTDEQKMDFIEMMHRRTKDGFLSGHVPSQIARTKTDILEAVKNQYTLYDILKNTKDEETRRKILNGEELENYKELEDQHLENVKKEFVNSFKPDALNGFAKMHHKGYQGEAKDGLIQLLEPEKLYAKYEREKNNNNGRNRGGKKTKYNYEEDEDEDDGMPADLGGADDNGGGARYSTARQAVDDLRDEFNRSGRSADADEFLRRAKETIQGDPSMFGTEAEFENMEAGKDQYTSVDDAYFDIMNRFFGGFNG